MAVKFNPLSGKFDLVNDAETAASVLAKLLTVDGAGSGLDADLLDGQHASAFAEVYTATEATILAATKSAGQIAYATDTYKVFVSLGSGTWREIPFATVSASGNPDMGYPAESNRLGYGTDYITDKVAYNFAIGGSTRTQNGGLRINVANDPDTLETYLRGAWYTILYDFTTANGDLRHTPLSYAIKVWSGMSATTGFNGRPIVNEYQVSMGVYPAPKVLNGGTF